jgi:sugar lactone lactonase YvrE
LLLWGSRVRWPPFSGRVASDRVFEEASLQRALRAGIVGKVLGACLGTLACGGIVEKETGPAVGTLWYGATALCGFGDEQLAYSAHLEPRVVISTRALAAVSDVAFDVDGNAWVVGAGSDDVLRYPAALLASSNEVKPDLVIRSAALKSPGNLAFDAHGDFWVVNRESDSDQSSAEGSLVRFEIPEDASGTKTLDPTVHLHSTTAGDFLNIGTIAFDAAGSLWVSSFVGLLRFDEPASKSGEVSLSPAAVIDKSGYANNLYFYSVAFDPGGELWAASGDGLHHLTSLTVFDDPGSLVGRSSPQPLTTITGGEDLLPAGGLAFDRDGNLWMATGVSLLMYSRPGRLRGTVNPEPAVTIDLVSKVAPTTNSHLVFSRPARTSSTASMHVDAQSQKGND